MLVLDRNCWRDESEAITRGVVAIASGRRLAGLTISLPPTIAFDEFREVLRRSLEGFGFNDVEVQARIRPGPIRMISAEFVR